jgi:hypothetical protein
MFTKIGNTLFRFLPMQLLLLHFRKYQILLVFWVALFAVVTNMLATHFGAASLFLSPEYLGTTSGWSYLILGGATAVFAMSWHITTFIIHSKRVPFLGATKHAFLKYCINNSIIPLTYLIVFGISVVRYLMYNENVPTVTVLLWLLCFYMGYVLILMLSFMYFFRADRNILKVLLSKIANPSIIRDFIPYDSLDSEFDHVKANSYFTHLFKIEKISEPYAYNSRFLNLVLRRHHRNAIFAMFFAGVLLLVLGIYMDNPILRIPAAAGFLLLFSILLAALGAFKYYLRSWEVLAWLGLLAICGFLAQQHIFDLRSVAYGLNYQNTKPLPYDYEHLKNTFSPAAYEKDKQTEINRLQHWYATRTPQPGGKVPMVIISVSGGGSRAAYWTFRSLQYADSLTQGRLFKHSNLITGASGGMIGASYWRSIHTQFRIQAIENPYDSTYQNNIGKDLLNAVIFSLVSVDVISPFNKISIKGNRYNKDRGYAFDQELNANTGGMLNYNLGDYKAYEDQGIAPLLMVNATIINDGRKLIMTPQPITYLTRSEQGLPQDAPMIDAVDFAQYFKQHQPLQLHMASALRMSATFPIILPMVKLPSEPELNVMDAGLRDNFGTEISLRYLHTFKDWMQEHISEVLWIQIRDTRSATPVSMNQHTGIMDMLFDPIFAIQSKWSAFQTYSQSYDDDYVLDHNTTVPIKKVVLQYYPKDQLKSAALNFHLTGNEKQDIALSVFNQNNQAGFKVIQAAFLP